MKLKFLGLLVVCSFLSIGAASTSFISEVNAENEHIEEAYDSLWINDLANFNQNGATLDASTYNVSGLVSSGSFIYSGAYKNVEYKVNVKANTFNVPNPWFAISARAESSNISGGTWEHYGYYVRLYANGMYEFLKDNSSVIAPSWGSYAIAENADMYYVLKVVDCTDGTVHITCSCNGLQFLDYYDTENVLVSGGFAGFQDSFGSVSFTGSGTIIPVLNFNNVCDPYTNANFPAEINQDKSITTNATGAAGYSGAVYGFSTTSKGYGYKVNVKPKAYTVAAASAEIVLQIGGVKGTFDYNRPNVIDPDWGWRESGYVFHYCASGQRHLYHGESLLSYAWDQAALVMDKEYQFEYSILTTLSGDRVSLKLDGKYIFTYFDAKTSSNDPVELPQIIGQTNNSIGVYTVCMEGLIKFDEPDVLSKKTLLTKDLCVPTSNNNSTFLQDGEVENFNDGVAAGYNAGMKNTSIVFNAKFTNFGAGNPGIAFMLNYVGSNFDGVWGGDWTSKGYAIILYANSMIGVVKEGNMLFEGWWTGGVSLSLNTNYKIEIGSQQLSGGGSRFFCKINDAQVLNFIDCVNPITAEGWFGVHSMGMTGSLLEEGITRPVAEVSSDEIEVGEDITLSYQNPQAEDTVSYHIDSLHSTGDGTISNNKFTATDVGTVYLYAVVNGVASEFVTVTIDEEVKAILTYTDDKLIVGGNSVTLGGELSDESPVTSLVFNLTPVSGQATINQSTGVMTGTKAGIVKVSVTVNDDKTSEDHIFYISPVVFVKNTGAIAKGGKRVMEYDANSDLPEETITYSFEIVDGVDKASIDNSTHVLTAIDTGEFSIKVTLTGETFTATSIAATMAVDNPVVVIKSVVKDMVVGQDQSILAEISGGEVPVTTQKIVIEEGNEFVDVNGMCITAVAEGTVKLHAELNDMPSLSKTIVISPLVGILNISDMYINDSQKITVSFNDPGFIPSSIEYKIISGNEFATVEGDNLKSGSTPGVIKVQATVNENIILTKSININSLTSLFGIREGDNLEIGKTYNIFCLYSGLDEVTKVEFIVSDLSICSFTTSLPEGEPLINTACTLKPLKIGQVKISAKVNDIESVSVSVNVIYSADRKPISMTLSGAKTDFTVGDEFTTDGLKITVTYSDGTIFDVNDYVVSSPDMTTVGTKDVTVSYTYNDETISSSYQINVVNKDEPSPINNNAGVIALSVIGSVAGVTIIVTFAVGIGKFGWFRKKK